jgi:hypothetical protein
VCDSLITCLFSSGLIPLLLFLFIGFMIFFDVLFPFRNVVILYLCCRTEDPSDVGLRVPRFVVRYGPIINR